MLRINCFQHVPYEGLGCIALWCETHKHAVTYTRFHENDPIPETDNYDWLIVMGGPMGVYDEDKFSWLKSEKEAIKQAIDANKTVIGICLGAQLIANVLGADVYPNTEKEIGWFNVQLSPEGKSVSLFENFEPEFKVFQWHGDTFNIPEGAIQLAQSEVCKNQALLYNEKVLGLQFHFEVTIESLEQMLKHGKSSLVRAPFIQSEHEILDQIGFIQDNNRKMYQILDFMANTAM